MFTGLIEEIGTVQAVERHTDGLRLRVRGCSTTADARHGDSISVNGVCLTVVERHSVAGDGAGAGAGSGTAAAEPAAESDVQVEFVADVMAQTLRMSTLGSLEVGSPVNLERAARLGDRLGGHIVQGHVDGTVTVRSRSDAEHWRVLRLSLPEELAPLVVEKGSITLEGVSLTVSAVSPVGASAHWFEVSLIPETLRATTLGERVVGDVLNVETDILARHSLRAVQFALASQRQASTPATTPAALPRDVQEDAGAASAPLIEEG